MNILEVIALNEKDVEQLNDTNIDRIEFCTNIQEDGLTPSKDVLKKALKITKKPINVMLRFKNSFIIEDKELNLIIDYLEYLNVLKDNYPLLNGIVIGYYKQNMQLDERFLKVINNKIHKDLKITFHKAVDCLVDNKEYLKLKNYNISTILTQGGIKDIENNIEQIEKMKKNLPNIELLLGGGINEENIEKIIKLNTSIHLGSLARVDKSYNKGYNIKYLNEIKEKMIGVYE